MALVLLAVGLIAAIIYWMPKRFSLRSLLLVMTLVAVVLGIAAYALRK